MILLNLLMSVSFAEMSIRLDLQDGSDLIVEMSSILKSGECKELNSEVSEDIFLRWVDEAPLINKDHEGEIKLNISSSAAGIQTVDVQGNNQQLQTIAKQLALELQEDRLEPSCDFFKCFYDFF